MNRRAVAVVAALLAAGCDAAPAAGPAPEAVAETAAVAVSATAAVAATAAAPATATVAAPATAAAPAAEAVAAYPWLADPSLDSPRPVDTIRERFPSPPPGFMRVAVPEGSFGAWLKRLPLAAPGTPVLSYRGEVILPADHANLAAVVAIDIGKADLQQCADAIIRLHAEWRWSRGERDLSYRAGAGTELPFARWVRGERPVQRGEALVWEPKARPGAADHRAFRSWLDGVFMWANTGALAKQARTIAVAELAPGDFVVQPGAPGHAVLVLDMARAPDGRAALLLGQSFMPAQNVQVLRPGGGGGSAWFVVGPEDEELRTPFWRPFPWRWLRRFGG